MLDKLRQTGLECTGCGACRNVCPTDAIEMLPDPLGFLCPSIDPARCVNCALCEKTCPVLNFRQESTQAPTCYAAIAEDEIRAVSSSGGAFSLLARAVLEQGGAVFGAVMDEDLTVHHTAAESLDELRALQKSKYVQSDTALTFRRTQELLEEGRPVLYTGCPCQIAGLKSYLGEQPDHLWTVDLLCHGVPSAQMLRQSLEGEPEVASVDFRDKDYGWESLGMTVVCEDGSRRRISYNESRYEQGFHPNMTLRESCYHCRFCDFPRQGDLSIGDFWSIGSYREDLNDAKGTSILLANNPHGAQLLELVRPKFKVLEQTPVAWISDNRVKSDIPSPPERERFLHLYARHSFNKAVLYAQQNKHDIGIVGNWSYPNYGTALTYYALYRVLNNLGYSVTMLSWPESALWKPYEEQSLFRFNPYPAWDVAELPKKRVDLYRYNDRCDTFVLGSDQLLNNNLYRAFDRFVQMDWVKGNRRKVAYATSFGADYIWGSEDDNAELAYFLNRFDAISAREPSGSKLLQRHYGVDAPVVLDPVFLLPEQEYAGLINRGSNRVSDEPYLFVYVLDQTREKIEAVHESGTWLNLPLQMISDAAPQEHQVSEQMLDTEHGVFVEEWLACIAKSEAVLTDSFHGTCMAILLGKPFLAISNAARGATRFKALLNTLGLEDRLCLKAGDLKKKRELLKKPPEREQLLARLNLERDKSLQWLKNALEQPISVNSITSFDLLSETCSRTLDTVLDNQRRAEMLERLQREGVVTDQKQWEQLEDHRLRLDGVDALLKGLAEQNANLKKALKRQMQAYKKLEARLASLERGLNEKEQ